MRIQGSIVYNDFEGGFWGILGDDGKRYRPTELAEEWQRPGLRVVVECERSSAVSFHMWGIAVDIESIASDDDGDA